MQGAASRQGFPGSYHETLGQHAGSLNPQSRLGGHSIQPELSAIPPRVADVGLSEAGFVDVVAPVAHPLPEPAKPQGTTTSASKVGDQTGQHGDLHKTEIAVMERKSEKLENTLHQKDDQISLLKKYLSDAREKEKELKDRIKGMENERATLCEQINKLETQVGQQIQRQPQKDENAISMLRKIHFLTKNYVQGPIEEASSEERATSRPSLLSKWYEKKVAPSPKSRHVGFEKSTHPERFPQTNENFKSAYRMSNPSYYDQRFTQDA